MKRHSLWFIMSMLLPQYFIAMESSFLIERTSDPVLQNTIQKRSNTPKIAHPLLHLASQYKCIRMYYEAGNNAVWAHNDSPLLALISKSKTLDVVETSEFQKKIQSEEYQDLHNLNINAWHKQLPNLPVVATYKKELSMIAWSPDNLYLAGVCLDLTTICILALPETTTSKEFNTKTLSQKNPIACLVWHPNNTHLITASVNSVIWIWNIAAATVEKEIDVQSFDEQFILPRTVLSKLFEQVLPKTSLMQSITVSPAGSYLATVEANNVVKIWDINFLFHGEKKAELRAVIVEHPAATNISWSPDGKYLAVFIAHKGDHTNCRLHIWDVSDQSNISLVYRFSTDDFVMHHGKLEWNKDGSILSLVNGLNGSCVLFHRSLMDWLLGQHAHSITNDQKIFLEKILASRQPLLIYDQSPVNGTLFESLPSTLQDALIRHYKVAIEVADKQYKKPSAKQSKQVIMAANGFRPDNVTK